VIPAALETERLTKRFGTFAAVEDVSLRVEAGEILALLGPNGAGKTTLLKMIRGLVRPTSGRILIRGADLGSEPEAARRLGYMSQKFSLYPLLTGIENLAFFGGISDLRPREVRDAVEAAKRRVPEAILRHKTRDVPPGYRQAVALIACLMTRPEILLLDEPTSGVGPDIKRAFWLEISGLKREGRTVLVTTHDLREAEQAERVLVVDRGRIAADVRTRDLVPDGGGALEKIYREAVGHDPRI